MRHYITGRHGIVMRVEDEVGQYMPAGHMRVYFPDIMDVETRWQMAFYETDIIGDLNSISGLERGDQGFWWEDKDGVPWYLAAEGISGERPSFKQVRKSRMLRKATPGTQAG